MTSPRGHVWHKPVRQVTPAAQVRRALPADWRKRLGAAVRARREALGWTRDHLVDVCGYSYPQITGLEKGRHGVSLQCVLDVLAAMGLQPSAAFAALDDRGAK